MGDLRYYELYVVLRPELEEDDVDAFVSQVNGLVEDRHGKVLDTEVRGLRKLSYAIQKVLEGRDVIFQLGLPPGATNEIERLLRLNEQVLRYLTTRIPDDLIVVPEAPSEAPAEETPEPAKVLDEQAEAEAEEPGIGEEEEEESREEGVTEGGEEESAEEEGSPVEGASEEED
jgi:small subunit ribosomal protein S6